ncbi:MAG: MFS transporter [Gammaproteobacteria bacterium]|jgi:MFS family permease|nr:MFS transporter [Gammaproteobacteria bacterium]MBT6043865.1 MFS transporter [Gammaproteobacteria bacterium]
MSQNNTDNWDTSYEWKIIALLSLTFGLVGLDRFILPVILQDPNSTMAMDLGLTPEDGGMLAGYLGMAWGISAFVMGYMADKLGRRAVLVPAILIFSLMSAFSGMATSIIMLVFVRVIMGLAEGPVASTGVAVAVEASKPSRRGLNNGIFQCMISLFGLALAPIIASRLLAIYEWHIVFMLVAIPGVIIAIVMWFVIREPLKQMAEQKEGGAPAPGMSMKSVFGMFGHRNAKVAPLTLMCAMGGIFVIAALLFAYLTAPDVAGGLGLDSFTAANVFTAVGVGGAIGQFAMPALSDIIGRKVATLTSYILAAVFLYAFSQAGPESTTVLWILLFFSSMFNFAALAILAGPVAAEAAPPGMLASMAGFVIFAGEFIGGGISPIIAGSLATDYGLRAAIYFACCGLVLGFIVALFLEETAPSKVAHLHMGKEEATPPM